jgi:competence protein ComEC
MTYSPMQQIPPPLPAPAFRLALWFAAGIWLGEETHMPPAAWGAAALLLWILAASVLAQTSVSVPSLSLLSGMLLLSFGALMYALDSGDIPLLPEPPYERSVALTGTVSAPPEQRGGMLGFTFLADSCYDGAGGVPFRARIAVTVRLSKKGGRSFPISSGMRLSMRGLISAPPRERNPGGFSLRRYYEAAGIGGVFSVEGYDGVVIQDTSGAACSVTAFIGPIRNSILRRIGEVLPGMEGEFLKDLLVGERSGIPDETKEAFIDSGVAHVLAVSGYRVLVVAGMMTGVLTLLRVPRRVRPLLSAPVLLFYMVLAIPHPPVVRGTVMALVFMLGGLVQRRSNSRNALGVAALLILAGDARQLFDAGFQLSFGAVLAILYFMPRFRFAGRPPAGFFFRLAGLCVQSATVSVVVSLGTLPLAAAIFGRVSIVGFLTNIVVVPATGAGMILGTLAIAAGSLFPPLGASYASLDGVLLHWTLRFAEWSASLPFAALDTGRFGLPESTAWYAAIALLTYRRDARKRAGLLALLLASLNVVLVRAPDPAYEPARGILRVSMIDVGQGDALLVEFPRGETLLVDTGPRTPAFDAGKKTVVPFLKRLGIRSVDLLVITHADADHCGGAASVISSLPVGRVIESPVPGGTAAYDSYHAAALARGTPVSPARQGDAINITRDARIYVLWPPGMEQPGGTNNASIVFRLVYGDVSFLCTGDAQGEPERAMVRSFGSFLRSTVLKVAHHGSESGTSDEFLGAVRPALALVSVGLHNRFHHPSPLVIGRLDAAGARVGRTDREGAVILTTDGRRVTELCWRPAVP